MKNQELIEQLLQSRSLRKTTIRVEMLSIFMNHNFALSANDVIERMKVKNDRATVYRALASFEKHGILHKAAEDIQGIKYALCKNSDYKKAVVNSHAHFTCEQCHRTYCLNEILIPEIQISGKYLVNQADYILRGVCKDCQPLN